MFLKTLQGIRQGATIDELDEKLRELGQAVKHTGKSGELILRLKVAPLDQSGAAIHIEDTILVKEPKLSKGKTVFFMTEAGELVKNDPRQRSLDLKSVESPSPSAEDLKQVG